MLEQKRVSAVPQLTQKTVGAPPAYNGYAKVAEYPIHELVMLNANTTVAKAENWRGSSCLWP